MTPLTKPAQGAIPRLDHPLADRLELCLLMNEMSGGNVYDLSGHLRNGTFGGISSTSGWVTTPYGPGVAYDGTDDTIDCGTDFPTTQELTVSTIVRADRLTPDAMLAGAFVMGGVGEWILQIDAADAGSGNVKNVTLIICNAGPTTFWPWFSTDSYALSVGRWHHIVATWKSGLGGAVYIDGIDRTVWSRSGKRASAPAFDKHYTIGNSNTLAKDFSGQIAMQMYWSRYMGPAEVAEHVRDPWAMFRPARRWWAYTQAPGYVDMAGSVEPTAATVGAADIVAPLGGSIEPTATVLGAAGIVVPLAATIGPTAALVGAAGVAVPLAGGIAPTAVTSGAAAIAVPLAGLVAPTATTVGAARIYPENEIRRVGLAIDVRPAVLAIDARPTVLIID